MTRQLKEFKIVLINYNKMLIPKFRDSMTTEQMHRHPELVSGTIKRKRKKWKKVKKI